MAERLGMTTKVTELESEIKRLKTENRRVTEERNILKEATVFFVDESNKNTRS